MEGEYYIIAVYDDPGSSTLSFSAYELENDVTYTYPLTYSQFDSLFRYDSELMNPAAQDGRFRWIIQRLDFVQDKRGQKVLCLSEEETAEFQEDEELVDAPVVKQSVAPANTGGKIDAGTRAKLLKELDTQDDAKLSMQMIKSEGARKRFVADLHAKRNLEQLKATQRLIKGDEDRADRLHKLEVIKEQQAAKAKAHEDAADARKSTLAQLEILMKQKEAQAIRRLIQEKDAADRGSGRERDAARQRRKMQERSAAEVAAIEAERAQQLARKREEQCAKREALLLKRNRQISEQVREERKEKKKYQLKLRAMKDEIIEEEWAAKLEVRTAEENKKKDFLRMEDVREAKNAEKDRARRAEEVRLLEIRRTRAEEDKEATLKRREKTRKETLIEQRDEASHRAQVARELARLNERREQKIQEKERLRLQRLREAQMAETARMQATGQFSATEAEEIKDEENYEAGNDLMDAARKAQEKAFAAEQEKQKAIVAAEERRKRQEERDEKHRKDAKTSKKDLDRGNPIMAEVGKFRDWQMEQDRRKKAVKEARLSKVLQREKYLKELHAVASNRHELATRLEVFRDDMETMRTKDRHQATIDHIKALPVGGGLPYVFVY